MGDTALRLVSTLPMVPCGSSPAARLHLARNEAPEEEADLGLCCNQMLDACWQRFEEENLILKNSFFNYGMFQRFTRITNSLTIFTKQYMLIASA